jgi:hypothetical protein
MAQHPIKLGDKAYPCLQTMGAALRFRKMTGKEVAQLDPSSMEELCTWLYCCVVSACKRDAIEFSLTLEEFADNLLPEDFTRWANEIQAESVEATASKKKSKK